MGVIVMPSPMQQFRQQRSNAKRRGIGFYLTFSEWWRIWDKSGMYAHRGRHGFVMGRIDHDVGYEVDNVEIIPATLNFRQAMEIHYGGDRNYT
jgi:hypothetical protein